MGLFFPYLDKLSGRRVNFTTGCQQAETEAALRLASEVLMSTELFLTSKT